MIYLLSKDLRLSSQEICDAHLKESIVDVNKALGFFLWNTVRNEVAFDAAYYYNDPHGFESAQSNIPRAVYPNKGQKDFYDWVMMSPSHYAFLIQYLINLTEEHRFRFNADHKLSYTVRFLPKFEFIRILDEERLDTRIEACKRLYAKPKAPWIWTSRNQPADV